MTLKEIDALCVRMKEVLSPPWPSKIEAIKILRQGFGDFSLKEAKAYVDEVWYDPNLLVERFREDMLDTAGLTEKLTKMACSSASW